MKHFFGAAVVIVLLASCGASGGALRSGEAATSTTATATALTTTSTEPAPDDGRLHRAYQTDEYQPGSISMGSWRMDVAPASVQPRMTKAQAIAAFKASSSGGLTDQPPNTTVNAYFGLFTGNAPNPPAPDGRLTGTHPIGPLPAWLIVVDGLQIMGSGGGPPSPGSPPTTPQPPAKGYALNVISDAGGQNLTGVSETGGSAADTGIG